MKRDCGKGELIIIRFELVWNIGNSDKEHKCAVLDPFSNDFDCKVASLPPFSNARLYACDKQGYMNCIRSGSIDAQGTFSEWTNRLNEV